MLRDVYGIDNCINEAPPRTALSMFGGPFDIETFRTQANVCFVVTPPFVSHCMLIEERQPIGNIDEDVDAKQRGTVRGLRRPCADAVIDSNEDMCAPSTEGMYKSFLENASSSTDIKEPTAKRAKTTRNTSKTIGGGGLAKFAK